MFSTKFRTLDEYEIFIEVVEVISSNDLLFIIGLPIGIVLFVGLVLFITTYYYNAKFESSEVRDIAQQKPFYYSVYPSNETSNILAEKKKKFKSFRTTREASRRHEH